MALPPTPVPYPYQVNVTIRNISGGPLGAGATDIRYRRVLGWDAEPTPTREYVTIGGMASGKTPAGLQPPAFVF